MPVNQPSPAARSTALAAVAALFTVLLVILFTAESPGETLRTFLLGPWSNRYAVGNLLSRAGMLIFTGAGVVIAFRAGVFNLGGEGQVYLSAVIASSVLVMLPVSGAVAVVLAAGSAAALGGLSGWLRH
ncbi:MAG TPA: ABC transporter permease, partial [Alkalispirochaeta sp.]|nr:ABC transporter permease [Alkalispirochaeta sp.]